MSEDQKSVEQSEEVVAAALSDGAYTLFVADFSDTDTAWQAYEALKSVEDGRTVEIEGVLVVKREADGTFEVQKATDHSTKHGLRWGLVGGVALGVLFPPSILGSAAVLGAAGAAAGKVRQRHHHKEIEEELRTPSLPAIPGSWLSSPTRVSSRSARPSTGPTRSSSGPSTRSQRRT